MPFQDPRYYSSDDYVNAIYMNADSRDNVNALLSKATTADSLLNPAIVGTISYSTNFPTTNLSSFGTGFPVGAVGIESTIDQTGVNKRQWRVAISYTMATNSAGTRLSLARRVMGRMGRPYVGPDSLQTIYTTPTSTTTGRHFNVSPWTLVSTGIDDIWQVFVYGHTTDSPRVTFSDLQLCFQVRDYV
jgi:hypothetical protein